MTNYGKVEYALGCPLSDTAGKIHSTDQEASMIAPVNIVPISAFQVHFSLKMLRICTFLTLFDF